MTSERPDADAGDDAYGAEFAAIFGERWDLWCRQIWPMLQMHLPAERNGRSWLDLCCGSGGLLKLAVGDGFQVTGIDRSRHQLANAARKLPKARLVEADARAFTTDDRFDVVTCVFDSLNYLTSIDDVAALFQRIASWLQPDGVFVFDTKTAEGFRTESAKTFEVANGTVSFESVYDAEIALHRFVVNGRIERNGAPHAFNEVHVQRAYEADALEEMLGRAGLSAIVMDFDTGETPHGGSRRLLFVARNAVKE